MRAQRGRAGPDPQQLPPLRRARVTPFALLLLQPPTRTCSATVPNGGPTWSSTGSESTVQAVRIAAAKLTSRLQAHVQVTGDATTTWRGAVKAVHPDPGFSPAQVMLTATGWFDGHKGDGTPVAYSTYGAACSEVEVDALTGERRVLRSDIVFDAGSSLNQAVDVGQLEGAFIQGLGMWVCEQVVRDPATGQLLSGSTWSYKIPTPDTIPQQLNVHLLQDAPNPAGVMSSKASGEPALMTSISILAALQAAAGAAARELRRGSHGGEGAGGGFTVLSAPATPQRIKAAVGSFSVAARLRQALAQGAGAGGDPAGGAGADGECEEGWLLVEGIAGARLLGEE